VGQVTGAQATGAVILSAVYLQTDQNKPNYNKNVVGWQYSTGNPAQGSSVGSEGGPAKITEGFIVPSGDTLMVTEVFLPLSAWVLSAGFTGNVLNTVLNGTTLYLTRAPDAASIHNKPQAGSAVCTK
jgi:hypothetical protein